ncbi:hypothetical protein SERLA73DRAFT_179762 [Serpula lacrymans var. lacrymans S7.3]|uniref:DUF6533 domain-containing protein n=1 Tax=Serpula lacrymans var. lacrymans (strain S7.3) TaxID=936435 RepID=F8PUC7_SERL3|nr:hypothetical protein SERLA73DRAFT_179762 [Serpula lacrymans var. lacrymans S7.3]
MSSESLSVSFRSGLQTSKYFNIAAFALWVFDYCITLETEVFWVWGKKWGLTRFMFTISRYLTLVCATMIAYSAFQTVPDNCSTLSYLVVVEIVIITLSTEGLLVMRMYAFWKCSKRFLLQLLPFSLIIVLGGTILPAKVNINDGHSNLGLCFLFGPESFVFYYMFVIVFEIVSLCLTLFRRYNHYYSSRSNLIRTLYRDGLLYIGSIILITLANIILYCSFPAQYNESLATFQLVLHSILASRILFNLHESDTIPYSGTVPASSIRFNHHENDAHTYLDTILLSVPSAGEERPAAERQVESSPVQETE